MPSIHLHDELAQVHDRVVVNTRFGPVTGGRARNGAAVFLGKNIQIANGEPIRHYTIERSEIPYALPPGRFENPTPLPSGFRYQDRAYITESSYAVQPTNDGQAAGIPFRDMAGFGEPTENSFFLNIVAPPSFPVQSNFAVKIYIHGGFLQFGSPHSLGSQAQYIAAERSEIWVHIGYRLSAFGFLACDNPRIEGNFGFKDQWVALEWIRDNISAFGGEIDGLAGILSSYFSALPFNTTGDPGNIQLTGLSAGKCYDLYGVHLSVTWEIVGAHSVHQLLHHASRLPPGVKAPFTSAMLQSNAIATNPKLLNELRPQFVALSRALGLDPDAPETLSVLRDPQQTSWQSITDLICSEKLGPYGTFRGCLDGTWLSDLPDPMTWQRTGGLARGLLEHGVRNVITGDLSEEWYLYSIAHPIKRNQDIQENLERYYSPDIVQRLIELYGRPADDAKVEDLEKRFGIILSAGQVHLPVRLLHRDLLQADYPTFRYTIKWTPEQARPNGYVTHGTDRILWAFRTPELTATQAQTARAWLDAIDCATQELGDPVKRGLREVLALRADKGIEWTVDENWDDAMRMRKLLPREL
ncbi:carboxylesterase [Russula earlei]|uniref:Carboxylesterase n=1 Tax=Russula earlei TaxID=71964 RepID=A0ACC0UQD1_9AGAM|nr:carboxylesterase [Russula earlei]